MRKRYVLITGTSTGIGYDAARKLIHEGFHVFGSLRKKGNDLGTSFTPLYFDVTDNNAVLNAVQEVKAKIGDAGLTGLVNNAGIAVNGPMMHVPLEQMRHQFEVNVFGVLQVTQAFLPLLGARKNCPHPPGRIINISSVSGRIGYPFLGPYVASKHALEGLSDTLRRELMLYGIDVIVIEPGSIQTPIWEKAAQADYTPYQKTDYNTILNQLRENLVEHGRQGLTVSTVSQTIYTALTSKHPKSRYALPRNWLTGWLLPRWLPARWLDKIMARKILACTPPNRQK